MLKLSIFFGKNKLFALGLTVLAPIFLPILAFSKKEYIGINVSAIGGKTIVEENPININEKEIYTTLNEEEDKSSKGLNISIGGGTYQKDYTKNLLNVEENQTIIKSNDNITDNQNVIDGTLINSTTNDNNLNKVKLNEHSNNVINNSVDLFNVPKIEVNNNYHPQTDNETKSNNDNIEYIICQKCGSRVKKGSPICFMCGSHLN